MEVRTILTLVLAVVLGWAVTQFNANDLAAAWWQVAIGSAIAALVATEVFKTKLGTSIALVVTIIITFALDRTTFGQNFWIDLIVWGVATGMLAALAMSFLPVRNTTSPGH